MSDVTAAIRDLLEADSGVRAITTRIRRSWARYSDDKPYIIIQQVGAPPTHHMGAASGLAEARVEINSIASSRGAANALSEAVREALDGMKGSTIGDDSLVVRSIYSDTGVRHLDETPDDGSQTYIYRDLEEYIVWYVQSVPTFS